ncbi:hypothetical protein ACFQ2K_10140 [Streptomyces sanglieri]|uniref:Uncharacterized protein n=1 Tax=Streptomyces sanglieri TaxID=193460 RepID=A0ABW2WT12_9ACTN
MAGSFLVEQCAARGQFPGGAAGGAGGGAVQRHPGECLPVGLAAMHQHRAADASDGAVAGGGEEGEQHGVEWVYTRRSRRRAARRADPVGTMVT